MRKLLCGIALTLLLSGCTSVTNGAAVAPLGKCTDKGFEDLPAASMQCGVAYETEYQLNGIVPRLVDVNGNEVMYLIYDTSFEETVQLAEDSDEITVRPYLHKQMIVNRLNDVDMVQILVSDDCEVEKIFTFELEGPICESVGPEFGQQVSANEASVLIGQLDFERIERVATDSNRFAIYAVSTAKSA